MSKRVRTARRRAQPTTVDVITPILDGLLPAATVSLQSLSLSPASPVQQPPRAALTHKPPQQRHVRFGNLTSSPGADSSDKWSPKESLALLAAVQSFDNSPGKEPNSVNWIQIAKIMNAHKSATRGADYFKPEMCRHEYIEVLGTYGNKVGPLYTAEDMCSRTLRYLIYDYEMSEARKIILENQQKETATKTSQTNPVQKS